MKEDLVVHGSVSGRITRPSDTPSYSELVRALAFLLTHIEEASHDQVHPSNIAQLEAARKLLLRAQAAQ